MITTEIFDLNFSFEIINSRNLIIFDKFPFSSFVVLPDGKLLIIIYKHSRGHLIAKVSLAMNTVNLGQATSET